MGLGDSSTASRAVSTKGFRSVRISSTRARRRSARASTTRTNKLGDGLDYVGADGAADAVEDCGDDVASDLGATPGEQQLGQTEEANELVHGNPGQDPRVREAPQGLPQRLRPRRRRGCAKVDSSGWEGEGGDALPQEVRRAPHQVAARGGRLRQGGKALDAYADTVKWAQGQAKEAIDLYKKGKKASEGRGRRVQQEGRRLQRPRSRRTRTPARAGAVPGPRHGRHQAGPRDARRRRASSATPPPPTPGQGQGGPRPRPRRAPAARPPRQRPRRRLPGLQHRADPRRGRRAQGHGRAC